jgi:hypothetical protein
MGRFAFALLVAGVAIAQPQEVAPTARKLAGMTVVFSVDSPLDIPGAVIQPGTYVLRINGEPRIGELTQLQLWDAGETSALAEMSAIHSPAQATDSSILAYYEGASGRRILKSWNLLRTGYSERIVYSPEQAAELAKITSETVLTMAVPGAPAVAAPATTASREDLSAAAPTPPATYPKTAGSLPLVLWVGFTALAGFAVFRIYRTDGGAAQNARNHAIARRAAAAAYRTYQAAAGKEA